MYYLIEILIPLLLFMVIDIHIRTLNIKNKQNILRTFESIFVLFYVIFIVYVSGHIGLLTMMSTYILSFSFIFREILANFGSTLIMYMIPIFKSGDIISINSNIGVFNELGLLRSSISTSDGSLIKVPNSTLLNGLITIRE